MLNILQRKSLSQELHNHAEYYLSSKVISEGEIISEYDIVIDGQFTGVVESASFVEIEKNALVKANIIARNTVIEGSVRGSVDSSESISVKNCAEINGSIQSSNLSVEKGAIINGKIKMEPR